MTLKTSLNSIWNILGHVKAKTFLGLSGCIIFLIELLAWHFHAMKPIIEDVFSAAYLILALIYLLKVIKPSFGVLLSNIIIAIMAFQRTRGDFQYNFSIHLAVVLVIFAVVGFFGTAFRLLEKK